MCRIAEDMELFASSHTAMFVTMCVGQYVAIGTHSHSLCHCACLDSGVGRGVWQDHVGAIFADYELPTLCRRLSLVLVSNRSSSQL